MELEKSAPIFQSYFFIFIGGIVILGLLISYFVLGWSPFSYWNKEEPYKVIEPETGYVEGTVINLYKNTPPGFPQDIVLEDKPIRKSSTLDTTDGKKQMLVSYISDKKILEISNMYSDALTKKSWKIISSSLSDRVSVIQASQGTKKLIITISPGNNSKSVSSLVTFQYNP